MTALRLTARIARHRNLVFGTVLLVAICGGMPARVRASTPSPLARSAAPNLNPLVDQALAAEARLDVKTALGLFRKARAAGDERAFVLQKIAKQCSDFSDEVAGADEKQQLCREALDCAQQAVALEPKNAVNVLSVAIIYGKLALVSDVRTKIEYSRRVRDYAEQALALDPHYADAHHVLGRWNMEIVALGATKRLFIQIISGRLPDASLAEAISHLRRAIELAPDVPAHRVELGFALLAAGQHEAARDAFMQALAFRPRERYDLQEIRRARAVLRTLS